MNKKRIILFVAVSALLLALAVGGTTAYYSVSEIAHNVITTSGVKIELVENFDDDKTWSESRGGEGEIVYSLDELVMPGTELKKEPVVVNTGNEDVYVRVEVDMTITSPEGEDLIGYVNPNLYAFNWDAPAEESDPSVIRTNHENWDLDVEDGAWLVYKGALHPGEKLPIFDHVEIDPRMTNEFQGCTVEITVRAQAVQAANNAPAVAGDYTTIAGWPAV